MNQAQSYFRADLVKLVLIATTVAVLGCGTLNPLSSGRESDDEPNQRPTDPALTVPPSAGETSVPITPLESTLKTQSSTVELRWTVPTIPVDGFILSYGFENGPLDTRVTIPLSELEREDKPEFGPVYRYLLKDIPRDRELRVSIASYRGKTLSQASPPQVVPINTPTPASTHPESSDGKEKML